jgi:hypothetical protein
MARLFAHWTHQYTHFDDRGRRTEYVIPGGEWREVPQDVADMLAAAAPQKLVILGSGEDKPGQAVAAAEAAGETDEPEAYETREVEEPEADRMARPKRKGRRTK